MQLMILFFAFWVGVWLVAAAAEAAATLSHTVAVVGRSPIVTAKGATAVVLLQVRLYAKSRTIAQPSVCDSLSSKTRDSLD